MAVVFGFDPAGTLLLTWTTRIYMLTLTGYALHEVMVRSFYARKEPWFPFRGILIRLGIYLLIWLLAVTVLQRFGAPMIALAELSITIEAVVLMLWLNRRLPARIRVWGSLGRGLLAGLIGLVVSYLLALYLPGPGYVTALAGMIAGGLLSLPLIWPEFRLLFRL